MKQLLKSIAILVVILFVGSAYAMDNEPKHILGLKIGVHKGNFYNLKLTRTKGDISVYTWGPTMLIFQKDRLAGCIKVVPKAKWNKLKKAFQKKHGSQDGSKSLKTGQAIWWNGDHFHFSITHNKKKNTVIVTQATFSAFVKMSDKKAKWKAAK